MRTFCKTLCLNILCLLAAVPGCLLAAQGRSAAGCPTTATLTQLTHALDAAVSGPVGKDRSCMRALFAPQAQLTVIAPGVDGAAKLSVMTVEEWIAHVKASSTPEFYEQQVKVRTERFGHLAHLWSTYVLRLKPDAAPRVRGINSIQAVRNGGQWQIAGILWQAETADEKLPAADVPPDTGGR